VNGEYVQQGDLNAIPGHARRLFDTNLGGFRTRKPMLLLSATTGSVPTNAPTLVAWNTVAFDTDNMFGTVVDTGAVIRTSGIYLVEGHVAVTGVAGATNSTPILATRILINGSNQATDAVSVNYARFQAANGASVRSAVPVALDVGAVVRMITEQNSGVSAPLDANNGGTRLGLEWLAPIDAGTGGLS
jgi:hypothetical protein